MNDLTLLLHSLKSSLEKNDSDLQNNYKAILTIGKLFQNVIGPTGMFKLFHDVERNHIEYVSDGLIIIKELFDRTENAIVKLLLKNAKNIAEKYGDGSKRNILFTCELLKICMELNNLGIHNSTIIDSLTTFDELIAKSIDNAKLSLNFDREDIPNLFYPFFKTKFNEYETNVLIKIMEDIFELIQNFNESQTIEEDSKLFSIINKKYLLTQEIHDIDSFFQILNIPGTEISETRIYNGIILDKQEEHLNILPSNGLYNCKVIISTEMLYFEESDDNSNIKFEIKYDSESINQSKFAKEEILSTNPYSLAFKEKSRKIVKILTDNGINLLITEKGIDPYLERLLLSNNIQFIRRVKMKQLVHLSRYLGINMVGNILDFEVLKDNEKLNCIGLAERVHYSKIGRDKHIIIEKDRANSNSNYYGTILVCGTTWTICNNFNYALKNGIKLLLKSVQQKSFCYENGYTDYFVRKHIKNHLSEYKPKVQFCLGKLSDSLLFNFNRILQNSGIDATKITTSLINASSEDIIQNSKSNSKNLSGIKILSPCSIYSDGSETTKFVNNNKDFFICPECLIKSIYAVGIEFVKSIISVDQIIPYQKVAKEEH